MVSASIPTTSEVQVKRESAVKVAPLPASAGSKVQKLHEMLNTSEILDSKVLANAKREADAEREASLRTQLKEEQKRYDYFIRACRLEEKTLLQKSWENEKKEIIEMQKSH